MVSQVFNVLDAFIQQASPIIEMDPFKLVQGQDILSLWVTAYSMGDRWEQTVSLVGKFSALYPLNSKHPLNLLHFLPCAAPLV
jgi:hypothetical protein